MAIGFLSLGGVALGYIAVGGLAVGVYAVGGLSLGVHTIYNDPEILEKFQRFLGFY